MEFSPESKDFDAELDVDWVSEGSEVDDGLYVSSSCATIIRGEKYRSTTLLLK